MKRYFLHGAENNYQESFDALEKYYNHHEDYDHFFERYCLMVCFVFHDSIGISRPNRPRA